MNVEIPSAEKNYTVTTGRGILNDADKYFVLDRKVLIVTDDGVPGEYAETVAQKCGESRVFRFKHGEKSKNIRVWQNILKELLSASFTRGDCVVAVGGGVVGDIAGFAASTYMRGVDFYNVPTTLLSQVDSSIGGKTAIDFSGVKNVVGSFYQPKAVLADTDTLKTLDKRQLHAGLAEAVKMAVTFDEDLLSLIENCENLENALPEIVEKSLLIKKKVVEEDPDEKNLRRALNFGHTIGHAVESAAKGKLLHGECVATGMIPMCSPELGKRVAKILEKYELPTSYGFSRDELQKYIVHDKKALDGGVTAVISENAGSFAFRKMTVNEILDRWEEIK